ncbi:MAG: nitroreductase [Gemmatimonadota bacterium]
MIEAIRARRSIKSFTDRPIGRELVVPLLDAAVLAPNHRMTEPWGFLVLGEEAKRVYASALAGRKAAKVADEAAAAAVREKVLRERMAVPCMIAVTTRLDENPEAREEDYAACFMGIQNLCLAAVEQGLGTHVRTGAVLQDAEVRAAWGVEDDRRVVAVVYVGEPAEQPSAKPRTPAAERTRWLP